MDEDPAHQFQMMLKPLRKAVQLRNLEAAVRFATNLLEISGGAGKHEDRKVHFLITAMEGASPDFKTGLVARLLDTHGDQLSAGARARLASLLERL